jgi:hypothetical protein
LRAATEANYGTASVNQPVHYISDISPRARLQRESHYRGEEAKPNLLTQ